MRYNEGLGSRDVRKEFNINAASIAQKTLLVLECLILLRV